MFREEYSSPISRVLTRDDWRRALDRRKVAEANRASVMSRFFLSETYDVPKCVHLLNAACSNIHTIKITGEPHSIHKLLEYGDIYKFLEGVLGSRLSGQTLEILPSESVQFFIGTSFPAEYADRLGARNLWVSSMAARYPYSPQERYIANSIERLTIRQCKAEVAELVLLINSCQRLTALDVEFADARVAHRDREWPYLGLLLRVRAPRLEALRLSYAPDAMDTYDRAGDMLISRLYPLADLHHLTSLKQLTASEGAVRGLLAQNHNDQDYLPALHQLLPASLRHLTIICEESDIRAKALDLLGERFVARLEEMKVMNFRQDHWYSSLHGEGSETKPELEPNLPDQKTSTSNRKRPAKGDGVRKPATKRTRRATKVSADAED